MRRVKKCDVFMNAQCSNNEKIMTCSTPLCHPFGVHVNSIPAPGGLPLAGHHRRATLYHPRKHGFLY